MWSLGNTLYRVSTVLWSTRTHGALGLTVMHYESAVSLLLWPSGMVHVAVLALVATSLDKMLTMLDHLCCHAENLVFCSTAVVTGYSCSHVTLT